MSDLTCRSNEDAKSPQERGDGGNEQRLEIGASDRQGRRNNENELVLVANDDHRLANFIAEGLRDEGFRTLIAYDGNVALAMALVKQPDFLVLDTRMPGRSGYLVLEQVRLAGQSIAPVIMLSDNEGSRHRQYCEMLGIRDFLELPMESGKLINVITQAISEHRIGS